MDNILNKILLFIVLCLFYLANISSKMSIIPILVIISIEGICIYFENEKLNIVLFVLYLITCLLKTYFIFFIPLIIYDLTNKKYIGLIATSIVILFIKLNDNNIFILFILIIISLIGYLVKVKTNLIHNQKLKLSEERDKLIEDSIHLENKIEEMKLKQNDEITIATLNERNRISREIHDNVGHLLSCSILQIGALKAISKDKIISKNLDNVKITLDEAMNSIRKSVHNLRDNSIDLHLQIKKLVDDFSFCKIKLEYDLKSQIKTEAKYNIVLILKEALNNVIKHSSATIVNVKLYEHPKIIQLIIYDNGLTNNNFKPGMGMDNIYTRVKSLNGNINVISDNGFKLFISFNKENLI